MNTDVEFSVELYSAKTPYELCFYESKEPEDSTKQTIARIDNIAPTFLHVFSTVPQTLCLDESVVFDSNSILFGGCSFVVGTSDIWLWNTGYYYITITVHHNEPCQLCLIKNESMVVNGGIFHSNDELSHITASLIFCIEPADLITTYPSSPSGVACRLQLTNFTSSTPFVSLNTPHAECTTPDVISSITIIMLSPNRE
jgi:hypothetical protein